MLRDIRDRRPVKIDLSRGRDETVINDEAAVLIAEALAAQAPPTVQHVDLQGNAIGDAGAAALAEVVAKSDVIVSLNLQWNDVGDAGAAALAEAIKHNTRLRLLGIFGNARVARDGLAALTAAAALNRTLKTLTVSFEAAGEDASANFREVFARRCRALPLLDAIALVKGQHPPSALDLGGQKVGFAGCQALSQALIYNRTVETVNLNSCRIDSKGAACIGDMLHTNKTIKHIELKNNPEIADATRAELVARPSVGDRMLF